jgi:dynein heavy chain
MWAAACCCCCCQVERYNSLLVGLRRSCAELVKGIKGLVVMSADLDQVRR